MLKALQGTKTSLGKLLPISMSHISYIWLWFHEVTAALDNKTLHSFLFIFFLIFFISSKYIMSDAKPLIFLLPVRAVLPTLLTNKLEHFHPAPLPEILSNSNHCWLSQAAEGSMDSFKSGVGCKSCDPFNIKGEEHESKAEYLKKRCFLVWINSTLDHRISPFFQYHEAIQQEQKIPSLLSHL